MKVAVTAAAAQKQANSSNQTKTKKTVKSEKRVGDKIHEAVSDQGITLCPGVHIFECALKQTILYLFCCPRASCIA